MKQGSFKIICLVVLACITVFSGYGQGRTITWESRILESFNGDDDAPYLWRTRASRFASIVRDNNGQPVQDANGNSERFPRSAFVEAWPVQVFGYTRPNDTPLRSLGIHGQFDRRGYNWIDLYPVSAENPDGGPVEITIPGTVQTIDCWVWGSNFRFYIEVYLRDFRGVVHALRLGDISYIGWRNLSVNIPNTIAQSRRTLPAHQSLTFVKFRIWTQPVERVDDFYIYFKQLKVLTDMFNPLFDGNDLAEPSNVERLCSGN